MKFTIFCMCLIFVFVSSSYTQDYWEQMNGPYGGIVNTVVIDSSGYIYAGLFGDGAYRSKDDGNSWEPMHSGLGGTDVNAFTVDSSGKIFAGTDSGAYCSTDHGNTWIEINEGLMWYYYMTNKYYPYEISALCVNTNGYVFAGTPAGLFRSIDNGENWDKINSLGGGLVTKLTVNSNGHIYVIIRGAPLVYSVDNGDNWKTVTVDSTLSSFLIGDVALNSEDHIFVSTSNGLYRSVDSCNSWSRIADIGGSLLRYSNDQLYLVVSGSFDDGSWIYRLTDDGENWSQMGWICSQIQDLTVNKSGHMFAGTYGGGIYRSKDNGMNWQQTSIGLPFATTRTIAVNSNGDIFAGLEFGGLFFLEDSSNTWVAKNSGLSSNTVTSIVVNDSGHIFAGAYYGIFHSADNGDNWTSCNTGLPAESDINVKSIRINSKGYIFANLYDFPYRSLDNGKNWTKISIGLSAQYNPVECFAFDSSGCIYVGTYKYGIYRSEDDGDNWTQFAADLVDYAISDILFYGSGIILVTTFHNGIFRSIDNGENWAQINNGLSDSYIYSIVKNAVGNIFCGTVDGIFQSIDNGNSWTPINSGLLSTHVNQLIVDANDYLYASTLFGGVYSSINPSTAIQKEDSAIPFSFKLEQNYPNPFNPITVISWHLAAKSHVNLSIYNILGQKVAILLSEKQNAGKHSIEWDASGLSSGIYFYRIQAGDFVYTKRMLLIK